MHFILIVLSLSFTYADYAILPPGTLKNTSSVVLSSACVTALESTVHCDAYLDTLSTVDVYGTFNSSFQQTLCSTACGTSLASYHSSVTTACAHDTQPWQGIPPEYYGNTAWAAWNTTCLRDTKTGLFCSGKSKVEYSITRSLTIWFVRLLCQCKIDSCGNLQWPVSSRCCVLPLRVIPRSTNTGNGIQQLRSGIGTTVDFDTNPVQSQIPD